MTAHKNNGCDSLHGWGPSLCGWTTSQRGAEGLSSVTHDLDPATRAAHLSGKVFIYQVRKSEGWYFFLLNNCIFSGFPPLSEWYNTHAIVKMHDLPLKRLP